MRLKASNIEGKLACEVKVKVADMNNLQAVIYCVRNLRFVRLEASHIGGKLAREVKAAGMKNLHALIY